MAHGKFLNDGDAHALERDVQSRSYDWRST